MGMNVKGAVGLVTGGNRGIGNAFVREMLEAGAAKVYLAARKLADAEEAAGGDDRIVPIQLDVSNEAEIEAAAERCTDVSILVNNAGAYAGKRLIGAEDMSGLRQEMEVNFFGLVAMCRAFARTLGGNGGGAIINVLSAGGIIAVPDMGGYSPSKFAARAASNSIRAELMPQGTQMTALIVGAVDTRMAAHVTRHKTPPEDIAKAGLQAIAAGIDEHDTDPHAVAIRAALARDPKGLERDMAERLNS